MICVSHSFYKHVMTHFFRILKFVASTTLNMSTSNNWKGAPLTMIYGSESPWNRSYFPPVQPGHNHTVLYHVPVSGVLADDKPPKPQIGQDKWDQNHVRLPCSKQSLYPVTDNKGETRLRKRWVIIENALKKPIKDSQELSNAILSYNTKFKTRWKFRALHKFFNECLEEEETQFFFEVTLPQIIKLVLDLPKLIQSPIPLLKQHKNMSISLSQQQVASLLANAFFCTFPRRNSLKSDSEFASYPYINFNSLYESSGSNDVMEKLRCICYYFRRVCMEVPVGVLTFERRSVAPRLLPQWEDSERLISSVPLHLDSNNTIEEADGLIQVDFANKLDSEQLVHLMLSDPVAHRHTTPNRCMCIASLGAWIKRFLGGGVLGYGCVQEEIRFVICPELLVSMLFTEVLRPNEAVMIIGAERYSQYSGYGHSFEWGGPYFDKTPRDISGRRRVALLAIDAVPYRGPRDEFRDTAVRRELNKAFVGFSFHLEDEDSLQYPGIATGNWGCGAFGGTSRLKSLLQLMACAQAKRPMAYYTFSDDKLADDILMNYNMLAVHLVSVGQLYKLLVQFCDEELPASSLHLFLSQKLKEGSGSPTQKLDLSNSEKERVLIEETLKHDTLEFEETVRNDVSSPDIFLLDNLEHDSQMKTLENQEIYDNKMASHENKMASYENKMEALETPSQSGSTSRLFEEMERMDEDNGSLNLKSPVKSPFKQSNKPIELGTVRIQIDLPSEAKRKISRKITDYFSKKPI